MAASPLEAFQEASREARFKRVNGDFVFRAPGAGAHHFLVSATQKAEIQRSLRPRLAFDRYTFRKVVLYVVLFEFFSRLDHAGFWPGFVSVFVLIWACGLIWQDDVFKRIGPALVGARYTEERIAWRERTETLVKLLPISKIIAVGVAATLFTIGAALALLSDWLPRPTGGGWGITALCAFWAGYFIYLAALKVARTQRPPTAGAGNLEEAAERRP